MGLCCWSKLRKSSDDDLGQLLLMLRSRRSLQSRKNYGDRVRHTSETLFDSESSDDDLGQLLFMLRSRRSLQSRKNYGDRVRHTSETLFDSESSDDDLGQLLFMLWSRRSLQSRKNYGDRVRHTSETLFDSEISDDDLGQQSSKLRSRSSSKSPKKKKKNERDPVRQTLETPRNEEEMDMTWTDAEMTKVLGNAGNKNKQTYLPQPHHHPSQTPREDQKVPPKKRNDKSSSSTSTHQTSKSTGSSNSTNSNQGVYIYIPSTLNNKPQKQSKDIQLNSGLSAHTYDKSKTRTAQVIIQNEATPPVGRRRYENPVPKPKRLPVKIIPNETTKTENSETSGSNNRNDTHVIDIETRYHNLPEQSYSEVCHLEQQQPLEYPKISQGFPNEKSVPPTNNNYLSERGEPCVIKSDLPNHILNMAQSSTVPQPPRFSPTASTKKPDNFKDFNNTRYRSDSNENRTNRKSEFANVNHYNSLDSTEHPVNQIIGNRKAHSFDQGIDPCQKDVTLTDVSQNNNVLNAQDNNLTNFRASREQKRQAFLYNQVDTKSPEKPNRLLKDEYVSSSNKYDDNIHYHHKLPDASMILESEMSNKSLRKQEGSSSGSTSLPHTADHGSTKLNDIKVKSLDHSLHEVYTKTHHSLKDKLPNHESTYTFKTENSKPVEPLDAKGKTNIYKSYKPPHLTQEHVYPNKKPTQYHNKKESMNGILEIDHIYKQQSARDEVVNVMKGLSDAVNQTTEAIKCEIWNQKSFHPKVQPKNVSDVLSKSQQVTKNVSALPEVSISQSDDSNKGFTGKKNERYTNDGNNKTNLQEDEDLHVNTEQEKLVIIDIMERSQQPMDGQWKFDESVERKNYTSLKEEQFNKQYNVSPGVLLSEQAETQTFGGKAEFLQTTKDEETKSEIFHKTSNAEAHSLEMLPIKESTHSSSQPLDEPRKLDELVKLKSDISLKEEYSIKQNSVYPGVVLPEQTEKLGFGEKYKFLQITKDKETKNETFLKTFNAEVPSLENLPIRLSTHSSSQPLDEPLKLGELVKLISDTSLKNEHIIFSSSHAVDEPLNLDGVVSPEQRETQVFGGKYKFFHTAKYEETKNESFHKTFNAEVPSLLNLPMRKSTDTSPQAVDELLKLDELKRDISIKEEHFIKQSSDCPGVLSPEQTETQRFGEKDKFIQTTKNEENKNETLHKTFNAEVLSLVNVPIRASTDSSPRAVDEPLNLDEPKSNRIIKEEHFIEQSSICSGVVSPEQTETQGFGEKDKFHQTTKDEEIKNETFHKTFNAEVPSLVNVPIRVSTDSSPQAVDDPPKLDELKSDTSIKEENFIKQSSICFGVVSPEQTETQGFGEKDKFHQTTKDEEIKNETFHKTFNAEVPSLVNVPIRASTDSSPQAVDDPPKLDELKSDTSIKEENFIKQSSICFGVVSPEQTETQEFGGIGTFHQTTKDEEIKNETFRKTFNAEVPSLVNVPKRESTDSSPQALHDPIKLDEKSDTSIKEEHFIKQNSISSGIISPEQTVTQGFGEENRFLQTTKDEETKNETSNAGSSSLEKVYSIGEDNISQPASGTGTEKSHEPVKPVVSYEFIEGNGESNKNSNATSTSLVEISPSPNSEEAESDQPTGEPVDSSLRMDEISGKELSQEAYDAVFDSLEAIKIKALPFNEEIEKFTELDDSNKHYYIEGTLRTLIDKLDDMFDDIGDVKALRDARKNIYRIIFPMVERLGAKVQENRQRKDQGG